MNAPDLRHQILGQHLKFRRVAAPGPVNAPFLPCHLQVLMPDERLTFPLYLKVKTGDQGSIDFALYLDKGEIIRPSWLECLRQAGVERFYVHEHDLDQVMAYLNNHLLVAGAALPRRQTFGILREHLTLNLHRSFRSPHLGANVSLAKKSLGALTAFMREKGFPWKLFWEMLHRDYTLYNHSVNVGLMGLGLMNFLGKPERDCLVVGLAGLFHDLGLTALDEELVNKVEPLTAEDRKTLETHPTLGYWLLNKNAHIPPESLRLVLEHHESADGSGYPQGLPLSRQHPYTRMLFVLESYDGLTLHRPYRPAYPPFAALKILQEQQGARGRVCEVRTLEKFNQFLALT